MKKIFLFSFILLLCGCQSNNEHFKKFNEKTNDKNIENPSQKKEDVRKAEELKLEEERKKAEIKKQEELRLEEERKAAELKKQEDLRLEEERKAIELRKQEELRKAEKLKLEEKRKAAELEKHKESHKKEEKKQIEKNKKNIKFKNCKEAKAAGYSHMKIGEPGYSKNLDRDGDGIACDKHR